MYAYFRTGPVIAFLRLVSVASLACSPDRCTSEDGELSMSSIVAFFASLVSELSMKLGTRVVSAECLLRLDVEYVEEE